MHEREPYQITARPKLYKDFFEFKSGREERRERRKQERKNKNR